MKKLKILIICICFTVLLVSTSACNIKSDSLDSDSYRVDLDFKSLFYYIRLVKGNLVYVTINFKDMRQIEYVTRNINGELITCGANDHFVASKSQSALDYPYLYFYIGENEEENGDYVTSLFRLNLENNAVDRMDNPEGSSSGLTAYFFNGEIVTIKKETDGNLSDIYLYSYNPDSAVWGKHLKCSYDNSTGKGEDYYGICSNDRCLFVWHAVYESRDKVKHFLEVLDEEYNIEKSIEIDADLQDYILTTFISDMQAFGDYVYFRNASNYGYLAHIEGGSLKEVYKNRFFEMAINSDTAQPVFFERSGKSIFIYDDEKEELIEYNLRVKDGYSIQSVLSDNEYIYIVFQSEDRSYCAYLVPRDDLSKVNFSCE